jgi:hypothetical protein
MPTIFITSKKMELLCNMLCYENILIDAQATWYLSASKKSAESAAHN